MRVRATLTAALAAGLLGGAAPAADAPNVQAIDGKSLKQAIAGLKGKAVVVNLWATWCPPCVAEFPDLVKLRENYAAKGLEVVGVSMDEPEDRSKVDAFILKQKARFPVYLRKGGSVEQFFDPVDKGWPGVVPTTYLFDKDGKRVGKPIVGERTYAQFEAAVKPLLK